MKFPKEIFWVTGWKNRLYHSRGHVKLSLKHNPNDRVYKLIPDDLFGTDWIEVTKEFK
ncbi:hypothetical protein [Actinomadura sp. WMMB 499]|uniref:hypothetical protein n=1 Tax=Actinomadura sp. WMMB 499 TaxID=1219491 RepID=UPI00159EA72E|nr:hypothetical protein [Actinomadura sp. WMMB 499]